MISKSRAVEILSNEYRKLNTEYRELYESSSDAIRFELEDCVTEWARGIYDKLAETNSAVGILITGLKTEQPIHAIKALRQADTRLGLKEAKDLVDAMRVITPMKQHLIPIRLFEPTEDKIVNGIAGRDIRKELSNLLACGFAAELVE